ncbi:MAG TPA: DUF3574 domain-containing protein [Hyphomonadaceae bacterium]|jgi:hypothetical protein|nr:DUF3574 domain-containing protein [Hyphomonadaceae bacterium]HPN05681.1 DUF3574 domain-containing protein [Hyphomonadaceae bacterium]
MRYLLAVAMLGLLPGCVSVSKTTQPVASACQVGEPMVETMLFLGLARPGGSVSTDEFNSFVEREVAPRWKEGFTILEGQGMWLSEQRNITEREPSRVLVRFHDGSAAASADIEAIRNAYIKTFDQDAVLRTDRATCADF